MAAAPISVGAKLQRRCRLAKPPSRIWTHALGGLCRSRGGIPGLPAGVTWRAGDRAHAICDRIEEDIARELPGTVAVVHVEPEAELQPPPAG